MAQVVSEPDDGFAKNTSMKNKLSITILTILVAFIGVADADAVTVKFKDKNFPPLKVVKTGNDWKLGER
jgi:hypothetical protein